MTKKMDWGIDWDVLERAWDSVDLEWVDIDFDWDNVLNN